MKNSLRILGVFLLTAIYYFGVSTTIPSPGSSESSHSVKTSEGAYFSVASSQISYHTVSSDLSFSSVTTANFPSFKYSPSPLWAGVEFTEKLISSRFAQYARFYEDFLILKRKVALTFPSHYFW